MSNNLSKSFVPFAIPCIGDREIEAVIETMRSGWLTTGPKTKEFETRFSEAVGVKFAMAVNSATAGLHLALEAIGIGPGDYVIVPDWTFTATAEVVRYLGAHPIILDVDRYTLSLDVEKLEHAIVDLIEKYGTRLKAIIPVHFAGQACDMRGILKIAKQYNLSIIEDAAHAFPTTICCSTISENAEKIRPVGSIGHVTVFSFYATKTIATGEGGMITTNDPKLASRMKLMRLHGINRDVWDRYTSKKPSWYYEVVAPGFKYNLTDIASSLGLVQLERAEELRNAREKIAGFYNEAFADIEELHIPVQVDLSVKHAWHLYVLKLNLKNLTINRDQFITEMMERGVGCSVHFIPLHMHPYWRDKYSLNDSMFPVASEEYRRVVSLPIFSSMTSSDIQHVISTVKKIITLNKV